MMIDYKSNLPCLWGWEDTTSPARDTTLLF